MRAASLISVNGGRMHCGSAAVVNGYRGIQQSPKAET